MRWAQHVGGMKEKCNTYRVLVGKPERKRLLSRPRFTWENNMKINIQEGCGPDTSG
jgi:hypothetical protein